MSVTLPWAAMTIMITSHPVLTTSLMPQRQYGKPWEFLRTTGETSSMFPFFSYAAHTFYLFLFFILFSLSLSAAVDSPDSIAKFTVDVNTNNTWRVFTRFLDAGRGRQVEGMAELKRYFTRFGYLPAKPKRINFDDFFDDQMEEALISYQENLGLSKTGELDQETVSAIVSPRCGVPDFGGGGVWGNGEKLKAARRFAYFPNKPRWTRQSPFTLTYAFYPENTIDYLSPSVLRKAFEGAFAAWSAAIPVNFTEADDYVSADIRIGWFSGDHGDGEAFDGVLGVLGHAFAPESGRLHLDAAERWAVDFDADQSDVAVDLQSVATHEIGHVLGLAHSSVKESVMYPSLSPRTKKLGLRKDDVAGIQALYGSNPNYRYNAVLGSDLSSGWALVSAGRRGLMKTRALVAALVFFLDLLWL